MYGAVKFKYDNCFAQQQKKFCKNTKFAKIPNLQKYQICENTKFAKNTKKVTCRYKNKNSFVSTIRQQVSLLVSPPCTLVNSSQHPNRYLNMASFTVVFKVAPGHQNSYKAMRIKEHLFNLVVSVKISGMSPHALQHHLRKLLLLVKRNNLA